MKKRKEIHSPKGNMSHDTSIMLYLSFFSVYTGIVLFKLFHRLSPLQKPRIPALWWYSDEYNFHPKTQRCFPVILLEASKLNISNQ